MNNEIPIPKSLFNHSKDGEKTSQPKILVVDEETVNRKVIAIYLTERKYKCFAASGIDEALAIFKREGDISIVLSSIEMSSGSGLDFLTTVKHNFKHDFEFIFMTSLVDTEISIRALRLGAHDLLVKPLEMAQLQHVIEKTTELLNLRKIKDTYRKELEAEVEFKTFEIQVLNQQLNNAYEDALFRLSLAAEHKDPETGEHTKRIGAYAGMFAECLGWEGLHKRNLELSAPLHDIGKIGIPDNILLKPSSLTEAEFEIIKTHSMIGYKLLSNSEHTIMRCCATIARYHHEKYDGSGYPDGLKGEDIPIEARITALCDVYDALRSIRPYKQPFDHQKTMKIILEGDERTSPEHFDPELLDIFRLNNEKFEEIFETYIDKRTDPMF